jgi:hypothetical protein
LRAAEEAVEPTERFAQAAEMIINAELQASRVRMYHRPHKRPDIAQTASSIEGWKLKSNCSNVLHIRQVRQLQPGLQIPLPPSVGLRNRRCRGSSVPEIHSSNALSVRPHSSEASPPPRSCRIVVQLRLRSA